MLNWTFSLGYLISLSFFRKNSIIKVYTGGDISFLKMINQIDKAKKWIWLETYTIKKGNTGKLIKESLIRATKRGVRVILVYDALGSIVLSNRFLYSLIVSGVKIFEFNSYCFLRLKYVFYRNHKKILLIDRKIAFCGGLNITDEYAGTRLGSNKFRDTLIAIKGLIVKDFLLSFLYTLNKVIKNKKQVRRISYNQYFVNGIFAQVLNSHTRKNIYHIQKSLEIIISNSVKFCYFTSPYFLPFAALKKAMIQASGRGVEIKILTAGISDVPIMRKASRHIYGCFLKKGIQIYEYLNKLLHV